MPSNITSIVIVKLFGYFQYDNWSNCIGEGACQHGIVDVHVIPSGEGHQMEYNGGVNMNQCCPLLNFLLVKFKELWDHKLRWKGIFSLVGILPI
jgi:hypothetical protein